MRMFSNHRSLTTTTTSYSYNTKTTNKEESASPSSSLEPLPPVKFLPYALVYDVIHIDDYTEKEIEACWYNSRDYKGMKKDIKHTVQMIESNQTVDENKGYCVRGVEDHTTDAKIPKYRRQERAIQAVLDQQEYEDDDHDNDEDSPDDDSDHAIAQAYRKQTLSGQLAAYTKGVADEQISRTLNGISTLSSCARPKFFFGPENYRFANTGNDHDKKRRWISSLQA